MNDLIKSFLEFKQHNAGCSPRTVEVYRLALSRLMAFLGERSALSVTQDDLLAFSGPHLHKMGLQANSRRLHVIAVREFFKWLLTTKRITGSPASGLPAPRIPSPMQRVMTLGNAEKLMWAPDFGTFEGVRDGAMLALLIGCGLRVSGLINLNDSNVIEDEVDGKVRMFLKVMEKGEKERKLSIPSEADLLLRMYMAHEQLREINRRLESGDRVLFVTVRNRSIQPCDYYGEKRRFNRRSVLAMVKKYGQQVEIPADQLHPHALRHLFGTELAEDDVDLLLRQKLMGHADPKTTAIYTNLAMRKLTKEADRANPLAKMRTPVSDLLKQLGKKG